MTKTIFGEHTSSDANLDPSLSRGRKITALYLGWQHPQSDLWLPVAKMTWAPDLSEYCFRYTQGMQKAIEISPIEKSSFIRHPDRLYKAHITETESLKFKSRMPLSRTRYVPKQQQWFGLPEDPIDPIAYVSRSGGHRYQDSYDVFPEIKPDLQGSYHFYFSPLGINQLDPNDYEHLLQLAPGNRLEVTDNRLSYGGFPLGRLPGYLLDMVRTCQEAVKIEVAKVNPKAPQFHSLLCHATVNGALLTPFAAPEYQTFTEVRSWQ
jgi:hypothetical protein